MRLSILLLLIAQSSFAFGSVSLRDGEFSAPLYPSTSSVLDKQAGMIIFDVSSAQFKGVDSSGNWDAISVPNGHVVGSNSPTQRLEQVTLYCNSSSGYSSQSGSWISSIGNISSGTCVVTIQSGMFSSTPTCTLSGLGSTAAVYDMTGVMTSTSFTVRCTTMSNTPCTSFDAMIQCMGPR